MGERATLESRRQAAWPSSSGPSSRPQDSLALAGLILGETGDQRLQVEEWNIAALRLPSMLIDGLAKLGHDRLEHRRVLDSEELGAQFPDAFVGCHTKNVAATPPSGNTEKPLALSCFATAARPDSPGRYAATVGASEG